KPLPPVGGVGEGLPLPLPLPLPFPLLPPLPRGEVDRRSRSGEGYPFFSSSVFFSLSTPPSGAPGHPDPGYTNYLLFSLPHRRWGRPGGGLQTPPTCGRGRGGSSSSLSSLLLRAPPAACPPVLRLPLLLVLPLLLPRSPTL